MTISTTIDKIIDDVIDAETPDDNPTTPQDERAVVTNDPSDRGGRTQFGISERSNPTAWKDGKVTEDEARDIYEAKYVRPFGPFGDHIALPQMVDFAVTSGPGLVATKIQEIVGADVDGIIGPDTLSKAAAMDPRRLNNALMAARLRMISRIVKRDLTQIKYLNGWVDRALEFML